MERRVESLGETAWEVLRRLVREVLSRTPGAHLVEGDLKRLELRLSLELGDATEAAPARFAEELVAAIEREIEDSVEHAAVFRPGHAFCHRCETAVCEHSRPPSHRHVFAGYSPSGAPAWVDFAQHCLERKHPETDRLYEDPPALLTWVDGREHLHRGLVQAFDRGRYRLLGQVTAGFFPVLSRQEAGRGVVALTMQAASSRGRAGRLRVGLNLLGVAPEGRELDALWDREQELPWRRSVRWAQAALSGLAGRRGPRDERVFEARVEGILRGLARRLEQDRRSRTRRTRHAQKRHASGRRPTRKAVEDARAATLDAVRVDERTGTLVILGDRGRTHFYTADGRLVSSVRYPRDTVVHRLKTSRWRPATPTEVAELRKHLED